MLWLEDNNGIIGRDVYAQSINNAKRRRNTINWPFAGALVAMLVGACFAIIGMVTVAVWAGVVK